MIFLPGFRFVWFVYLLLRHEMWSWDTFLDFDRVTPSSSEVKIYYFYTRWKAQPVDMLEQKLSKQKRDKMPMGLCSSSIQVIPQGPKYIPTTKVILLWSLLFFIVNFTDVVGILPRFSAQLYKRACFLKKTVCDKWTNLDKIQKYSYFRETFPYQSWYPYQVQKNSGKHPQTSGNGEGKNHLRGILAKIFKNPDCIFIPELPTRVY